MGRSGGEGASSSKSTVKVKEERGTRGNGNLGPLKLSVYRVVIDGQKEGHGSFGQGVMTSRIQLRACDSEAWTTEMRGPAHVWILFIARWQALAVGNRNLIVEE